MRDDVLTEAWIRELATRLEADDGYRQAAAAWEGSLVLALEEPGADGRRAAYLDLWHGECREAREASPEDLEGADFVLQADRDTWQGILDGRLDVVMAAMSGRLRLVRGSLTRLMPHTEAARALLAVARGLEQAP